MYSEPSKVGRSQEQSEAGTDVIDEALGVALGREEFLKR